MKLKEAINNIKNICISFDDCKNCPYCDDNVCIFYDEVPGYLDSNYIRNKRLIKSMKKIKKHCRNSICSIGGIDCGTCDFDREMQDSNGNTCMFMVKSPDEWER